MRVYTAKPMIHTSTAEGRINKPADLSGPRDQTNIYNSIFELIRWNISSTVMWEMDLHAELLWAVTEHRQQDSVWLLFLMDHCSAQAYPGDFSLFSPFDCQIDCLFSSKRLFSSTRRSIYLQKQLNSTRYWATNCVNPELDTVASLPLFFSVSCYLWSVSSQQTSSWY